MPNINDYLKWRGDISFQEKPLNEIDNMILSRFSYLPFNKIDMEDEETIGSVVKKFKKFGVEDFNIKGDKPLVENLDDCIRFKDLKITDYAENTDLKLEKQFAAITIHLNDDEMYISFCGTDNSIVGWKEDFNLSFMQNIPAQLAGVKYLKDIAHKYNKKMYIGGHSKGGNIAVYSAVFAGKQLQDKIINVTNHDGPGFDETIIGKSEYRRILDKLYTYIPQSSVIGRLLEHEEKYKVVKSIEKGIMQHDIYSWQVLGTKIVQMKEVTNGSELINKTIKTWLKETSPEDRKVVIDILYNVIESTNATTMREISTAKMKNVAKMLKSYRSLDEKDRKMVNQVFASLGTAAKENIKVKFDE